MSKRLFFIGMLLFVAACGQLAQSTGDSASDPQSAQNLMPNIAGYTASSADNIVDALTTAGAGAALTTGNAPLAAALTKINDMIQCYQNVGAVAANIYVQNDVATVAASGGIPSAGAVAIINVDRVQNNFLACALGTTFGAQSTGQIEPCGGSGSFTYEGDTITYVYGATTPVLCNTFQLHFNNLAGQR